MHPEWWARRRRAQQARPGRPDPEALHFFRRFVEPPTRRFHRPVLDGTENLPTDRPYLLVANHSGGLAVSELFSFAACYLDQVGADRPLAGMAHPFALSVWPIRLFTGGLGAIPSTYEAAEAALRSGIPVLVFPGGDYEATRPLWQAHRVQFAGRRGFLRIARETGVPIVPMGIRGSHWSVPILWRSRWLLPWLMITPRLVGAKRMPMTVLGLLGLAAALLLLPGWLGLGWGWTALIAWAWIASPFPVLPWVPSRIRMRIGEAISAADLFPGSDDDLAPAYERVQSAVQKLVDSLA